MRAAPTAMDEQYQPTYVTECAFRGHSLLEVVLSNEESAARLRHKHVLVVPTRSVIEFPCP